MKLRCKDQLAVVGRGEATLGEAIVVEAPYIIHHALQWMLGGGTLLNHLLCERFGANE
jgi:hypothetical protein